MRNLSFVNILLLIFAAFPQANRLKSTPATYLFRWQNGRLLLLIPKANGRCRFLVVDPSRARHLKQRPFVIRQAM